MTNVGSRCEVPLPSVLPCALWNFATETRASPLFVLMCRNQFPPSIDSIHRSEVLPEWGLFPPPLSPVQGDVGGEKCQVGSIWISFMFRQAKSPFLIGTFWFVDMQQSPRVSSFIKNLVCFLNNFFRRPAVPPQILWCQT